MTAESGAPRLEHAKVSMEANVERVRGEHAMF